MATAPARRTAPGASAWSESSTNVPDGNDVAAYDVFQASVGAFGTPPGTPFADAHAGGTGSATWNGSLLGVDIGRAMLLPVFGDASLTVDLADLDGWLAFSSLSTVVDGAASPFRDPSLGYDITITANGFADAANRVDGAFYGPGHEEMAGMLDDRGVNLMASFGGTR